MFPFQQAVEKALKGLLALHDQPISRTHDLRDVGQAVGDLHPALLPAIARAAPLSVFASRTRYPQPEGPSVDDAVVEAAIAVAAEVVALAEALVQADDDRDGT